MDCSEEILILAAVQMAALTRGKSTPSVNGGDTLKARIARNYAWLSQLAETGPQDLPDRN